MEIYGNPQNKKIQKDFIIMTHNINTKLMELKRLEDEFHFEANENGQNIMCPSKANVLMYIIII